MTEGNFVDAKKVALGGSLHLLQAPLGTATAIEHPPDVPVWSGIAAGAAQAQYCGKEDNKNQRDASTTRHAKRA